MPPLEAMLLMVSMSSGVLVGDGVASEALLGVARSETASDDSSVSSDRSVAESFSGDSVAVSSSRPFTTTGLIRDLC